MQNELLNIGLAFIEGFALILSPCILPILPIILSASIEGSKKRPYGIILGFVASFALFTFFSRKLVLLFGINLDLIRNISFALLIIFGLVMISSYLTEKFGKFTQVFANLGSKLTQNNNQGGFGSGLFFGSLVGLIWTPCAGPILAAVIVQSILQDSNISSFLTILAFGFGAAVPMTIIIIFGRSILASFGFLQNKATGLRKILGLIIILAVLLMMFGNNLFLPSTNNTTESLNSNELINGLTNPAPAPEFIGIKQWINSEPLHIDQLRGKVVLVDFWAYSCINCIRTLPYLTDWYKKYSHEGLVIVGIHAPEFDFERSEDNLREAVKKFGIHYPVGLDNDFATWRNYDNHYWPAHYLIDKHGYVVYHSFGEGDYDITENNIRFLLGIKGAMPVKQQLSASNSRQTPETYLGYARSDEFASPEPIVNDKVGVYSYPQTLAENAWALEGAWDISEQKITSQKPGASIRLHFYAKKVFAVMGTTSGETINVKIRLKNKIINQSLEVKDHKLYDLTSLVAADSEFIELITAGSGIEIYTFTFGD